MKRMVLMATLAAAAVAPATAIAASSPTVVTGPATSLTDSTADLHGTVNPDAAATTYLFEWGPTTTYGLNSPAHSAGSGSKAINVGTIATGLVPGTTYHYRLIAFNRYGAAFAQDHTFTTTGHPPAVVITGLPGSVGHTSATVTGSINPEGEATNWGVQYGTTTAYDRETVPFGSVAAASSPVAVQTAIDGLAAGTTFHYRLVAIHGATVVSYGGDQEFITQPFDRPLPLLHVKAAPHQARVKPYLYTISGSIVPPVAFPPAWSCNGTVAVRFIFRQRTRALALTTVQPNCTFSTQFLFHRLIGKQSARLRLGIRFRGNAYVGSTSAATQFVRLG